MFCSATWNTLGNTQHLKYKAFTSLKKQLQGNKWFNETTEIVEDIKLPHAEHGGAPIHQSARCRLL